LRRLAAALAVIAGGREARLMALRQAFVSLVFFFLGGCPRSDM
jgi:hypothetical protein